MGYQEREQREFQGLYDTRKGVGAPRWSAEDSINIDYSFHSIRGRPPTERAIPVKMPVASFAFNRDSCVQSDYFTDSLSLSSLTDSAALAAGNSYCVRVYVSQIDLIRLAESAVGTEWVIAESFGGSPDSTLANITAGWGLILKHTSQDNFGIVWRIMRGNKVSGAATTAIEIVYGGFEGVWTSKQDTFCIEKWWDVAHAFDKFDLYKNGSNTASVTSSLGLASYRILAAGPHFLNIGAYATTQHTNVPTSATPNGFIFVDGGGGNDQITRADGGSWIDDNYKVGDFITASNATTGANDGRYAILAVTALTLDIATASLTADTDDNTVTFARDYRDKWENPFPGSISPLQILQLNVDNGVLPRRRWESIPAKSQALGGLGSFAAYIKFTINGSTHVPTALTDFMFPVEIVSNDLKTTANGGSVTSASGFDIVPYVDFNRTAAYTFELAGYDGVTGTVNLWIKSTLAALTDKDVFLFFGDPAIVTDQTDVTTTGVFESYATTDAEASWYHCDFNNRTIEVDTMLDKTGNGIDLDHAPTPNGLSVVTGKVHNAVQGDGTGEGYMSAANLKFINSGYTVTCWIRGDGSPAGGYENCFERNGSGTGHIIGIQFDRVGNTGPQNNTVYGVHQQASAGTVFVDFGINWFNAPERGIWNMYTLRWDGSNNLYAYLDGVLVDTLTGVTDISSGTVRTQAIFGRSIAYQLGGTKSWDEGRWAWADLGAAWILAEYNSQKDGGLIATGNFVESQQATAFSPYAQFVLSVEAQDAEGYEVETVGQSAYTGAGVGVFRLNPPPVLIAANEVEMQPQHGAVIEAAALRIDETQVWGVAMGVRVEAPAPGKAFSDGTRIVGSGTKEAPSSFWVVTAIDPAVSGYRIRLQFFLLDTSGVTTTATLTTGDLTEGQLYRIAFFVERNFDTAVDTTVIQLWLKTNGTWASIGSTAATAGSPQGNSLITFGGIPSTSFSKRYSFPDFRLHANLGSPRPATAGAVGTIDTYPPAGALTWPDSVVISIDAASTGVRTEALLDGRLRMLRIADNRLGIHNLRADPTRGKSRFSAVGSMIGGDRHASHGVHSSSVSLGDRITQILDSVNELGVFRYDFDRAVADFFPGPPVQGSPTEGISGIDVKDRSIYFGGGMHAFKLHPTGSSLVGLQVPQASHNALGTSSAGSGGLTPGTAYTYKYSCYNSQTGQESNLSTAFVDLGTTAGGQDTLDFSIDLFFQPNGDDWDTINIYRKAQVSGLYQLEQSLPKPYVLPDEGAAIAWTSSLPESELLLKALEQIDNDIPEEFTTAAFSGRALVTGGSGRHPGWAYYSKALLQESFPPLNVWQLDDDDGNRVTAIKALFGRLVIFKQRSIFAVRDDAPETGEQPQLVHEGRGCVNSRAVVLADNRIFFVSPDRVLYATDGVELFDVSTPSIRQSMTDLTVAQLQTVQLAHHSEKKQIWMSVGSASPDVQAVRTKIFVFDYQLGRWSKYQLPHNAISTGHEGTGVRGEYALIGTPNYIYKMGSGRDAAEGGATASFYQKDYSFDDGEWIQSNNQTFGFTSLVTEWDADIEGSPVIVVFYSAVSAFSGSPKDHPLFAPASIILQTWITSVTHSAAFELWLAEPLLANVAALGFNRALVMAGQQHRKYVSQWYSPQGEGLEYTFSGWTWVVDQAIAQGDMDTVYRVYREMELGGVARTPIATHDATEMAVGSGDRFPEHSFSYRQRGRRVQYELQSGINRTRELEIQRAILRYRIRGPRRNRGRTL